MICKKCGTKFTEGIFCPECGMKYEEIVTSTEKWEKDTRNGQEEMSVSSIPTRNKRILFLETHLKRKLP